VLCLPFWSSFSPLGARLPTWRFCAMLILTNQSWVLVVAYRTLRLISSVHGDRSKSSRYCHGPRLVALSLPRVAPLWASVWSSGVSCLGTFLLVCPRSQQEKHRPLFKALLLSLLVRGIVRHWSGSFFGHFLAKYAHVPWQWKHRPSFEVLLPCLLV